MTEKGYVEMIIENFMGREVEIFTGDYSEKLIMDQFEREMRSVIRGVVKGGNAECLILTCQAKNKNKTVDVYVNSFYIQMVVPGEFKIGDVFEDEEKALKKKMK